MSTNFSFPGFIYGQLFTKPPYPTTRLTGLTAIITGSNTGLGLEAARHITQLGAAKVILAVRDTTKGETARASILQSTGVAADVVEVWELDLAVYASVLAFAARVDQELERLDIALLNAGINTSVWGLAEGQERTITVNVTSTFLLALLLLPKMKETGMRFWTGAPGVDGDGDGDGGWKPHLSVTSSEVSFWAKFPEGRESVEVGDAGREGGGIFRRINDENAAKGRMDGQRYCLSKLLEVFVVREIGERTSKGVYPVVVNCFNPGLCHSELQRERDTWGLWLMKMVLARSTEVGSRTLVHAGVDAGAESHGRYLSDCQVVEPANMTLGDEGRKLQKAIWEELAATLEGIRPGVTALI